MAKFLRGVMGSWAVSFDETVLKAIEKKLELLLEERAQLHKTFDTPPLWT